MKIGLISSQQTTRLLRLKELIKQSVDCSIKYAIIDYKCNLSFEEFDYIILCSPIERSIVLNILNSAKGKIIFDINPQHNIDSLGDNVYYLIVQNEDDRNKYMVDTIGAIVISGLVDYSLYRQCYQTIKSSKDLIVDLNYNTQEIIKRVPLNLTLNAYSFGHMHNVDRFEGISFDRGLVGFELCDNTLLSDCGFALFTHSEINIQTVIPDTLIDFALIGVQIIVDSKLERACRFVIDNNCGFVINSDEINLLPDMISVFRKSNKTDIYNNLDLYETKRRIQSIFL